MSPEQLLVLDDETDYYGKKYWLEHQQEDFGYADIHTRARNDLTERNLHWLKALIKYRLPPANILELGCAHGSFVAVLKQAGYEASGVEMSPWVVSFGQETFGVPIHIGPIESLDVPPASLDAIALMDVLEHLPDPTATMRHCLELLKPEGLLLIQTPQFKEGMRHEELVQVKHAFLDQLKSDEHLYLFSERSVTEFFHRLGAEYIQFEPAIFAHYDMFFAVSRAPLQFNAQEQVEATLLATPNGRLTLALLDLYERDRHHDAQLGQVTSERNLLQSQLADLQQNFDAVEQDRAARGAVIEDQGKRLAEVDHLVWLTEQNRDWWKAEAERLGVQADRDREAAVEEARSLKQEIAQRDTELAQRDAELAQRDAELAQHDAVMARLCATRWYRLGKKLRAI